MAMDPKFWHWFFGGYMVSKGGWRKIVMHKWFVIHMWIGAIATCLLQDMHVNEMSKHVILPIGAIFIGLCFAWSSNAYTLMRDKNLRYFLNKHPDGAPNYIYTFQMGILIFITTIIYWGIMGLIPVAGIPTGGLWDRFLKFIGLVLFCISIRECWSLPLGVSYMLGIANREEDASQK